MRNEYPWMVRIPLDGDPNWNCGGSLINSRWVLTAGVCADVDLTVVILGDHDRTDSTEDQEVEMEISDIIKHPNTKKIHRGSSINQFNVLLLKLKDNIDFSKHPHIRPVCLPEDTPRLKDYVGWPATVTGWGMSKYPKNQLDGERLGHFPSKLQYITGVVKSNLECSKMGMGCKGNAQCDVSGIPDNMLCVSHHGGKLCQDDFGGPLVTQSGWGYEQIGVASFTPKWCNHSSYGGYARVTTVLGWIKDTVGTSHTNCPRKRNIHGIRSIRT